MSLSEYEQRQLDEIEIELGTDDPDLGSQLRSGRGMNGLRRRGKLFNGLPRFLLALSGLVAGLLLLLVGLRVGGHYGPPLGVAGYIAVVAATHLGLTCLRRIRRPVHATDRAHRSRLVFRRYPGS